MSKQKLVHYIIIGLIIATAAFFSIRPYTSSKEEATTEQVVSKYRVSVTDAEYDSLVKNTPKPPPTITTTTEKGLNYEILITAIVALAGVWMSLKSQQHSDKLKQYQTVVEKYQEDNIKQHEEIKQVLVTVVEQRDKQEVINQLDEITTTVCHLTDNVNHQTLLESLNVRTKQFVLDIMTDELTPDLYDYAVIKLNSKCTESLQQVKDMEFSQDFYDEFVILQAAHIVKLRKDLYDIMQLKIVNHKYYRFGSAIKTFLTVFSRDTLKLCNKQVKGEEK